jgi:methylated-DNA-[protein]-cysteine S-methyltransferase
MIEMADGYDTIFVKAGGTRMFESDIKAGRITKGMTFNQKVWALTSRIPKGKVATYGGIARKLNSNGCRAVGNALNKNPYAPEVPCHRVVGSTGALTGFAGGLTKKQALLSAEGVRLRRGRVVLDEALIEL